MRVSVVLLGAVLLVGAGSAQGAVPVPPVATVAYELDARLSPTSVVPRVKAPGARGRFEGLLVRTGPVIKAPPAGTLPAGCEVVEPPPGSGRPTRIVCDDGPVVVPLEKTPTIRWVLAWRLTLTGLSGRATAARIHEGRRGRNGPVLLTLCRRCKTSASGRVSVPGKQASGLISGADFVSVGTAKHPGGEVRGQIVRSKLAARATLSAPTHSPTVETKWYYTVKVTDLAGKPLAARVTVEIVDPFGGVHPVEFGDTEENVVNHAFTGVFRDYVIWPPESAIPGVKLVFRPTVTVAGSRIVLTYSVTPRR